MLEAVRIFNAAASEQGMYSPIINENVEFWRKNEAASNLRTVPGELYGFKIHLDSVGKEKLRQIREHGVGDKGALIAALALADACERLRTSNEKTIFNNAEGHRIWVRGLTPQVVLFSHTTPGIEGSESDDHHPNGWKIITFASSISGRN